MNGLIARVRSFWRGVRSPERVDAEMEEEMRFHIEMEAERLVRERGLEEEEARRLAAIAFGGVEKRKEEGRAVRGMAWVSGMSLDFRLGARMLAKHPGLTVVGVVGMAGGIAFGAAWFSFIATMVDPAVPLEEGDRVVALQNLDVARGDQARETHLHDLEIWREELGAVDELGAYRTVDRNVVSGDGRGEPLRIAEMTASGFRIARVPPLLGRYFHEDDEREGAPNVLVIGYDVWRRRFDGRTDVIGATLQLGAEPHTVIGVMPEGFAFPVNNRLWTPLRLDPSDYERGRAPAIDVFGRLAASASLEQADAQLGTLGRRLAAAHPATHRDVRPKVLPYTRSFIDSPELTWAMYLAQLLVGLLLAVVAVNVAILVYARTAMRSGEIAVRLALGASRARVVGQLFVEALVLSLTAAAVGLLAAWVALRQVDAYMDRIAGEQVPFWWDLGLSAGTVLYVTGLAVFAALIVGVFPALKATGRRVQSNLREAGAAKMRMGGMWTALIVCQVAVAMAVLPATSAMIWREFFPAGVEVAAFSGRGLLRATLGMHRDTPPSAEAERYEREFAVRFADRFAEVVSRLEAEPGVAGVSFAAAGVASGTIEIEGRPGADASSHAGRFVQVAPDFFDVFGATQLAGRTFAAADVAGPATAVVVNRSFVDQVLEGRDPLGRRLRYLDTVDGIRPGGVAERGWYQIVGVVQDSPVELPHRWQGFPTLYHPTTLAGMDRVDLLVRLRGTAPERFAGRLRELVTAVDPTLWLGEARTIAQRQREEERTRRTLALSVALGALTILLFSAAGIHALMSFTVVQRRKEIGIRSALGAQPRRVLASVFARSLRQLGLGVALGGALGGAVVFGDGAAPGPAAALLLAVGAVMLAVGLLATLGPARRGLRVEPMEALRAE